MPSILEGYSYDIFISYRHKDNKYDGWVTEFVDNLKKELEATFKEEISLYFDINPHDGLLETHDVDDSLKEKLKCLVFIPIVSRTYCDPKSFAWKHEFEAFIEQASKDRFGLKVKLPGGNIAGRVLPVRIHDLISEDIKLCETILGGALRGVEFIYKSPGVNRPLRQKEDNPHDNQNHTIYRDQINKVANAVNEIIMGLKAGIKTDADKINYDPGQTEFKTTSQEISVPEKTHKPEKPDIGGKKRGRLIAFSTSVAILAVFVLFLFSSGSTLPFRERDWILITDFENLTGNPLFEKSLYTAFSLSISQSRYINVLPRSRMLENLDRMNSADRTTVDEPAGKEIAVREGIDLYIVPGISEAGSNFAITSKIVETASGNIVKSQVMYADTRDDILSTLDQLSRKIRRDLGESRYNIASQDKPLKKVTTSSLEALKLFSQGIDCHLMMDFECARNNYENALKIDTGFTSAKASLGNILIEHFHQKEGYEIIDQAIRNVDNLTEKERLGILAFHAVNVENNLQKGIEYASMRTRLYPDDAAALNNLAYYYMRAGMYDEALKKYKATVKIFPDMVISYGGIIWIYSEKIGNLDSTLVWAEKMISDNPQNAWGYMYKASAMMGLDDLKAAEAAFLKAREIDPDLLLNEYRLAHVFRIQGRYNEAIEILKKILQRNKDEASAYYDIGINYQAMGNTKEAMKNYSYYRKIAEESWTKEYPDLPETYISLASIAARTGDIKYSSEMLRKASGMDSTLHEKFAGILCLQGKIPEAVQELEKAVKNGYRDIFWIKYNPDYQLLQTDYRFRNLISQYF